MQQTLDVKIDTSKEKTPEIIYIYENYKGEEIHGSLGKSRFPEYVKRLMSGLFQTAVIQDKKINFDTKNITIQVELKEMFENYIKDKHKNIKMDYERINFTNQIITKYLKRY